MFESETLPQARATAPTPAPFGKSRQQLAHWYSILGDEPGYASKRASSKSWKVVCVPHNWDDYHGYRVDSHGNQHGTAWYQTSFIWEPRDSQERVYAFFEGVGSYADVYANGQHCGSHAGGRTTFTVDLTPALQAGKNLLAVRAHHPEGIDDLPFVCGGCWGAPNTEGTQPFGMSRPAWLEYCGPVRIEPFGVHMLTPEVSKACATVASRVTLLNPDGQAREIRVRQELYAPDGSSLRQGEENLWVEGEQAVVDFTFEPIPDPELWCPESPALHVSKTEIYVDGKLSHQTETTFGLRWLEWPTILEPDADHNTFCSSRHGEIISTGLVERTESNNGLTHILEHAEEPPARLAPMGVLVQQRQDTSTADRALLRTSITVDAVEAGEVELLCEVQNDGGTIFFHQWQQHLKLKAGRHELKWDVPAILHPHRWREIDPYLHRLIIELRSPEGVLWERSETCFGIRGPNWDLGKPLNLARPTYEPLPAAEAEGLPEGEPRVLKLNGEPLFLNGTCEYENLLGCDHAFSDEQIDADVAMMKAAGFNAFRDAHHPHNLRYYDHWDRAGIVCWTQIGSHMWADNDRFRANHRRIVTEWVKERRNHPCIIIWGLQNESAIPEDFAREMRDLIRELDPTSPAWRLTTTCNGGKGTDWNVPQEWSGTYGGSCHDYDLPSRQLVGEYGAWRAFGVHTEIPYIGNENDRTESWACYAMETKIYLAEQARNRAVGHFHWVFNSFPNPGRTAENYEGPGNGQIGPINNKGLLTAWHQPSDLYYLFRSNYTDPATDPMVYLVSHTWPDRWQKPAPRSVIVYSNCEEVELYNGVSKRSLGVRRNPGRGRHFEWQEVEPTTNILHAVAREAGRVVAEDLIVLDHLPEDGTVKDWIGQPRDLEPLTKPALFLVNCGSQAHYQDPRGLMWAADQPWSMQADWGWESWGCRFDNIPDDLASQGETITPVRGSGLQGMYRHYRYGREQLKYHFRTGPGRYRIVCHFAEPWFGVDGAADCHGWRLFDVAINGETVESNLDVWSESGGSHHALLRSYIVTIEREILTLHFPRVSANQALIFGIEVLPA